MTTQSSNQAANVLEPWLELKDKVVMVTGASSGLGREFCLDLAKAGCRIVAAARRIDRLQSLCDEINNRVGSERLPNPSKDQPRAVAVELDVGASGASVEASVDKAWDAFGRVDALINNAGTRGIPNYFFSFFKFKRKPFQFSLKLFLEFKKKKKRIVP